MVLSEQEFDVANDFFNRLISKKSKFDVFSNNLMSIMYGNITYNKPDGTTEHLTAVNDTRKVLKEFTGKPFGEVVRPNAEIAHLRFFCISKGISFDELKQMLENPDLLEANRERLEKIGQEYFDMIVNKDFPKIVETYLNVNQEFKGHDLSFLNNLDSYEKIEAAMDDIFIMSGAQSFFVQTICNSNAKSITPEQVQIQADIRAAFDQIGEDFDNLSYSISLLEQMTQSFTKTITKYDFKNLNYEALEDLVTGVPTLIMELPTVNKVVPIVETGEDLLKYNNSYIGLGQMIQNHILSESSMYGSEFSALLQAQAVKNFFGDSLALHPYVLDKSIDIEKIANTNQNVIDNYDIYSIYQLPKKEFKELIKSANEEGRPFSRGEAFRLLNVDDGILSKSDRANIEKLINGDFSDFENMSNTVRNTATALYMANHVKITSQPTVDTAMAAIDILNQENPNINYYQHPLLRLGISQLMRSEPEKAAFAKELDSKLNQKIMESTLKTISPAQRQKIQEIYQDKANDIITENASRQKIMAKALLMAQLGGMTVKNGADESLWASSVSNAFAHCSRVAITMPAGDEYQSDLYNSLFNQELGEDGLVEPRFAATHSVERQSVNSLERLVEKKGVCYSNQYGMNVPIGGLGNLGISGTNGQPQPILADGSCGHMYFHVEKGDKDHMGGMLIGFESDATYVTNQMGHQHDIFATPEKASSFGGQRADEIGNKYGGRDIDLSAFRATELSEIFEKLDAFLGDYTDSAKIDAAMEKLCGPSMNLYDLGKFLETIGIPEKRATELASKSLQPALNENEKRIFTELYDASKNLIEGAGTKMDSYQAENLSLKYYKELNSLDADKRDNAFRLINLYNSSAAVHEQETEISQRLAFIGNNSELVNTDATSSRNIRKTALLLRKQSENRMNFATEREETAKKLLEDYLEGKKIPDLEVKIDSLDAACNQFSTMDNPSQQIASTIRTSYDQREFNSIVDKLSSSKRTFLGITRSNSKEYEDVLSSAILLQKELNTLVDPANYANIASLYHNLKVACQNYEDTHRNPSTETGKDRLETIKLLKSLSTGIKVDKYKKDAFFSANEGKTWADTNFMNDLMVTHESEIPKDADVMDYIGQSLRMLFYTPFTATPKVADVSKSDVKEPAAISKSADIPALDAKDKAKTEKVDIDDLLGEDDLESGKKPQDVTKTASKDREPEKEKEKAPISKQLN